MTDWFRQWHGAPADPKWRTIARRAQVRPGDVFAVISWLWDRASQASDRGSIAGYDCEIIADTFGYEYNDVDRILTELHDKGIITDDRITAWEKFQPKREREGDDSSARVKEFRERQAAAKKTGENHVTPRNAEKRLDTDTDTDISSLRSDSAKTEKPAKPNPKGHRLDQAWVPDNHDLTMAVELIGDIGAREEILKFRDYWSAKPGKDGRKLDWAATWRNWIRRAADDAKSRAPPARGGGFAVLHASLGERLGK